MARKTTTTGQPGASGGSGVPSAGPIGQLTSGRLKAILAALTPPADTSLELSRGNVSGQSAFRKWGCNLDVDTAEEDLWDGGGDYTGFDATAAETVTVVSDDANDTSAGTGARTVEVYGLDSAWAVQSETVTLAGATPVDTANTYIRLYRAVVRSAGSGATNAGTITIAQKVTTANVFVTVLPGYAQSMVACYTIPAGKEGYLTGWSANLAGKTTAQVICKLLARPTGEVFQTRDQDTADEAKNAGGAYPTPDGPYAAKTDIKIRVDSDSVNTIVAGSFSMTLVDT